MSGPQFGGSVLPGGLARVEAHYFLKATDGAVIEVTNPGVRTATPEVTEQLARGEVVDTSAYYFGTTPRLDAPAGAHEWMRRSAFIARGIRRPDTVEIDCYVVRCVGECSSLGWRSKGAKTGIPGLRKHAE